MSAPTLRIGELARRTGVSPDTIRHYERLGVVPTPHRNGAGYRIYSETSVGRVQFVRSALRFGFSLKQLGGFIRAREAGRPPCREVREAAEQILTDVDRQVEELIAARATIRATLVEWDQRLRRQAAGGAANLLSTLRPGPPRATSIPRRPR